MLDAIFHLVIYTLLFYWAISTVQEVRIEKQNQRIEYIKYKGEEK